MTWFWFSIVALLCWSGSDFFSKIGCRDGRDKYSQFKMVMAVGAVMGIHALYEIFVGGVEISWQVIRFPAVHRFHDAGLCGSALH